METEPSSKGPCPVDPVGEGQVPAEAPASTEGVVTVVVMAAAVAAHDSVAAVTIAAQVDAASETKVEQRPPSPCSTFSSRRSLSTSPFDLHATSDGRVPPRSRSIARAISDTFLTTPPLPVERLVGQSCPWVPMRAPAVLPWMQNTMTFSSEGSQEGRGAEVEPVSAVSFPVTGLPLEPPAPVPEPQRCVHCLEILPIGRSEHECPPAAELEAILREIAREIQ